MPFLGAKLDAALLMPLTLSAGRIVHFGIHFESLWPGAGLLLDLHLRARILAMGAPQNRKSLPPPLEELPQMPSGQGKKKGHPFLVGWVRGDPSSKEGGKNRATGQVGYLSGPLFRPAGCSFLINKSKTSISEAPAAQPP